MWPLTLRFQPLVDNTERNSAERCPCTVSESEQKAVYKQHKVEDVLKNQGLTHLSHKIIGCLNSPRGTHIPLINRCYNQRNRRGTHSISHYLRRVCSVHVRCLAVTVLSHGAPGTAEGAEKGCWQLGWPRPGACLPWGGSDGLLMGTTVLEPWLWPWCVCGDNAAVGCTPGRGAGAGADDRAPRMKPPHQERRVTGARHSRFTSSVQAQDTWPRTLEAEQL